MNTKIIYESLNNIVCDNINQFFDLLKKIISNYVEYIQAPEEAALLNLTPNL